MSNLPRIMIVVWRWGNSITYRLPEGKERVIWAIAPTSVNQPGNSISTNQFIQMDLHARDALTPLASCVRDGLARGNVLLFLHDNHDHGYDAKFCGNLYKELTTSGEKYSGQFYIRLFTGGIEPIYCTKEYPRGILGTQGLFASDVRGLEDKVKVVLDFDPDNDIRTLNAHHFDFVWNHYWNNHRLKDRLYMLKERFWNWAKRYDDVLHVNSVQYTSYLNENIGLWKGFASFSGEETTLKRLERKKEHLEVMNNFAEFEGYIKQVFPQIPGKPKSEPLMRYENLRETIKNKVFFEVIEEPEQFTLQVYNDLDYLHSELPG